MKRHLKWKQEAETELSFARRMGISLYGGKCGAPLRNGLGKCQKYAGLDTAHLGVGMCIQHGGNSRRENCKGAWIMAHEIAQALNVTPWEALLGEVRRTAGGVAWLDRKVSEAPDDEALLRTQDDENGPGYARWVDMRMKERQHLARVSKMAIDAGVAQQLVNQFALQGETIARIVTAVANGLGLTQEQESRVDDLLRDVLLSLEATATENRAIEGSVVDVRKTRG
jgi:hypothetical protein